MVSEDRQRVIETNRSLRLIKNELESLLEKGVISDAAFDSIMSLLPAESSLSGPAARSTPTPSTTTASTPAPPAPNSNSNNNNNPPSYAQSQTTAQPPALPARNQPPQPPAKPVLARARALYRYAAGDARDVSFERDDALSVFEYMNDDWWLGRNERTGEEGIFPRSYVVVIGGPDDNNNGAGGAGEKVGFPPAGGGPVVAAAYNQQPPYQQGGGGGYPVSPVPVGGYAAPPPPAGQVPVPYQDGQHGGGSKLGEQGKKFGKKLGNAAIFGAGATIGSNIVNSIF